jgi:hypothetical protein
MSRSIKKKDELIEKKLKSEQNKLSKKLTEVLAEYKQYWPKGKFEQKVEKTIHLFLSEKKLKIAVEKPATRDKAKKETKKDAKKKKAVE